MTLAPAEPAALAHLRLARRHFDVLDFTRLLAAVAVLFWHYQHFFVTPALTDHDIDRSISPWYAPLQLLYDNGHLAVQYFWAVSGFVFAHVYLSDPQARGRFWRARFARLWPLHLLTLVLVAVLQATYVAGHGVAFIYTHNAPLDFVQNAALAHYWFGTEVQTFNGPTWSLSTEIVAYALFWLVLPLLRRDPLAAGLAVCLALAVVINGFTHEKLVVLCLLYFFGGVVIYGAALRGWVRPTTMLAAAALSFALFAIEHFGKAPDHVVRLPVTFAVLFLTLAAETALGPREFRLGRRLGDASYGTYLWHFPLQLVLVLLVDQALGSRDIVRHPAFLLAFVALAVLAGFASHRWLERPAQRWLLRQADRIGPSRLVSA